MAEIPSSWELTQSINAAGKAEIKGRDDHGQEYLVRTCDTGEVTTEDLRELHAADRETYPNPENRAREFVAQFIGPKSEEVTAENFDDSEWIEAALPVVHAGLGRRSFGYSRAYSQNFDQAFKSGN